MDPNKALVDLRWAAARWLALDPEDGPGAESALAEEMQSAFEALDGWLSGGGFLPDDWSR